MDAFLLNQPYMFVIENDGSARLVEYHTHTQTQLQVWEVSRLLLGSIIH